MHRLDNHINDVEPRINAICRVAPSMDEDPTLQVSLSSYGWILLDSWVAWRTLRFLLRDTIIDETVNEKWFSTPSSYTASQLKAIWGFKDSVDDFLNAKIGKGIKNLIDQEIQNKRNASAHSSKKVSVQGNDFIIIKDYFKSLSTIFRLYELNAFIHTLKERLIVKGITIDSVWIDRSRFPGTDTYINEVLKYENSKSIQLYATIKNEVKCFIELNKFGTFAWGGCGKNCHRINTPSGTDYIFFTNKGHYTSLDFFLKSLFSIWGID